LEEQLHVLGKQPNSLPKETAMKETRYVFRNLLPAALVIAGFCSVGQTATAQSPKPDTVVSSQDQSMPQPDNQKPASETKTFTGKIVKSGKLLVLTDAQGKVTYKLDDQQKAQQFVNQNVKVTGFLDDSTGVIRVTAIEPA
jgi:hypothetical protein